MRIAILLAILAALFATREADAQVCVESCPDLTLVPQDTEGWFIGEQFFIETDCAVLEGLAQPGLRKLLYFTTTILNKGEGPLHIGQISQSPQAYFDNCHGHWHLRDFAEYRLLERRGSKAPLVVSAKQGYCPIDQRLMVRFHGEWVDADFTDPRWATQTYHGCDDFTQSGIGPGWADTYGTRIAGQWLDVTDVPTGTYTLELTVNPLGVFEESNLRNNDLAVTVVIP